MLKKYLQKISEIKVELIETKLIDGKIINLVIFGEEIPKDLYKYKIVFLKNMLEKTNKLLEIIEEINNLSTEGVSPLKKEKHYNSPIIPFFKGDEQILEKEIFIKLKKIEFLKKVYDVEANKLDSDYVIKEELEDYDYYNKIFYGFTQEDLKQEIIITENKENNIYISKKKLIDLLEFTKTQVPELKYNFGNFAGLSHDFGILNIPDEKEYNIKRIIAIFFHEITHFFRYLNGKNNLGFDYIFADYDSLEEGITTYNEYYYGNQIIDYGKYNAYYDKCYQVLLKNISEKEKKDEFYNILKNKGFQRKKTDLIYTRFFRYTKIGSNKLFLKELIYNNAYHNVVKLLKEDKDNYEKILAGKIGLYELKNNLIKSDKNFDDLKYYDIMVEKIKNLIK